MRDASELGGLLGGSQRGPSVRLRPAVSLIDLASARYGPIDWSKRSRRLSTPRALVGLALALAALLLAFALTRHASTRHAPTSAAAPAVKAAAQSGATVVGEATFYAGAFDGQTMADGATFNMDDPTIAAANRWPLGEKLCVRRVDGGPWDSTLTPQQRSLYFGRAIEVTVTDRGAFTHALDLSRGAFAELGRLDEGVIRVAITPAPDQTAASGCGAAPSL